MRTPAELHNAIATVCPINGVAVVDPLRKDTWRIDFADAATAQQKAAAEGVIAAFDFKALLPPTSPDMTPEQKLAAAGLTISDLKTLLGLAP